MTDHGRVPPKAFFIEPMTAVNVDRLPKGEAWSYEAKLDGYRAVLLKRGEHVEIRSRRNHDLTKTYPAIVAAARSLVADHVVLDGEIVALDAEGRPSFQALQHHSRDHTVVFYAFDALLVGGVDLTGLPLVERRRRLRSMVAGSRVLLSEDLPGTAAQVITAIKALGLEGVIAKRKDSRYVPGLRSEAWLKLKLDKQQEFVVGGYRPGAHGVDTLLVGYYQDRRLLFAAKVRAGFTADLRRQVHDILQPLTVTTCPFTDLPNAKKKSRWGEGITAEDMPTFRWVQPKLVAQIRFVEWTDDAHLRHAAFIGVREDKRAADVRRE